MRIPINNIKLNPGRRTTEPEDVENLAKSIAELGLLNPITINQDNTLIAGRHRLEAAGLDRNRMYCWGFTGLAGRACRDRRELCAQKSVYY